MFSEYKKKYGISKRWIATQLGIQAGSFQFYEENGFPPHMLREIERILHEMGKDLMQAKMPKSLERN